MKGRKKKKDDDDDDDDDVGRFLSLPTQNKPCLFHTHTPALGARIQSSALPMHWCVGIAILIVV